MTGIEGLIEKLKQPDVAANIAQQRIGQMRDDLVDLYARSFTHLLDFKDHPDELTNALLKEQGIFYQKSQINVPTFLANETVSGNMAEALSGDDYDALIIIANHPPFEKTVVPDVAQYYRYLEEHGRHDVAEAFALKPIHLPAMIARRAAIAQAIQNIVPLEQARFDVVGVAFSEPLSLIQQHDRSIAVPYGQGLNGFDVLRQGVRNTALDNRQQGVHQSMILAFPEGKNPPTIEQFSPFHRGVFAAAGQESASELSFKIMPLVMAVASDLSVVVDVLPPFYSLPQHSGKEESLQVAQEMQGTMFAHYQHLLYNVLGGNFYWKGMEYPYGGPSRNQIQNMNRAS